MVANHLESGELALTLPPPSRPTLSRVRTLSLALALTSAGAGGSVAHAQTPTAPPNTTPAAPDSLSPDSLAARLARAEAAIAALRQQLATESQSTVHTRSRLQLELTGRILTNGFYTFGRANNVDVPLVALAPSDVVEKNTFGATVRQSRIGGIVTVSDVLGGTFIGDLDLDFFGGVQNGPGDRRLFPEPRLRTSRARLRWSRTEIMVGSDVPLISQINPVSLAASGVPNFSGSGNLWNWLGQLRISQELGAIRISQSEVRWALQGAVMSPYAAAQYPGEPDSEDAGERSTRPAFEGRFRAQWGDTAQAGASDVSIGEGGGEIGVGVHRSWVADGEGELYTSHALAMDARISFTSRVELRGEAYAGRLLRGLGGGAIGQAFGRPLTGAALGRPIRDRAGWAQLNAQVHSTLLVGSGCGLDVVNGDDRPTRNRNTVCAGHLLWRPSEPIVVGLEYRGVKTNFDGGGSGRASHINLAIGFEL